MPPSTWPDGITAALAVAALGSSLVVAPILESTAGSGAEVIVDAINPIGDLVLASVVVGVIAFNGGRPGRSWVLLAAGFGVFAAAESVHLYRLAAGGYDPGTVLDPLLLLGSAIVAIAAWQRPRTAGALLLGGWRTQAMSATFGLASVALLVVAGLGDEPPAAVAFAAGALIAAMLRSSLTVRDLRVLGETRQQATTDELTGLPNRRWFDRRLREAIEQTDATGGSLALLVINLDHFALASASSPRASRTRTRSGGSRTTAPTWQGYHIARPLPAAELDAWLAAGGFVLSADDEHVERARAVDALDAVELDVGSRGRA